MRNVTSGFLSRLAVVGCLCAPVVLYGQAPAAAPPAPSSQLVVTDALNAIQPLIGQLSQTMSSVDVRRWKTPNDVRDQTSSDMQSIQRDMSDTLPGLLKTAQDSPGRVAPSFAVFRNIDALYDVLLRITETATLAGAQADGARLEEARTDLLARRSQLGTAIQGWAAAQDGDVQQLRTSLQTAQARLAQAAPAKKIVVNDGPDAAAKKPARKRKPAASPEPNPAPATPPQQ